MIDTERMFAESARLIRDIAANPLPIVSGIGRWFDYCEAIAPAHTSLWQRLRRLDYDLDAHRLTARWLDPLLAAEPPPDHINGLWFGLHNPVLDDGEPTCGLYLSGSSSFVPDSDSDEWVCALAYRPHGRYARSSILTELYRAVEGFHEDKVSYLGEPFLCHGYVALLVSQWCHGPMRRALLGDAPIRAVAMGHDSGDFYRIAVLRKKVRSQPGLFPE